MITPYGKEEGTLHYFGKSTDTKPDTAPNGSDFYEIDTGKVFLFDVDLEEWIEQ